MMSGHFYLERDLKFLKLDIFKNVQNDPWRFSFKKTLKKVSPLHNALIFNFSSTKKRD